MYREGSYLQATMTTCSFLSDQVMCLLLMKKSARNVCFSALKSCFRGPNHGYKDFDIPQAHNPHYFPSPGGPLPLRPVWLWSPSRTLYHQYAIYNQVDDVYLSGIIAMTCPFPAWTVLPGSWAVLLRHDSPRWILVQWNIYPVKFD